ncbi:hypothetical protein CBM2587_A20212 [Cupriavidus taiwanensis]|uniref:Uncharacterized protein n=1 Tax=Cupriavidus taiwanensis TaxID=164546 RepID=A0A975X0E0_9BURK|nr:hypothetical protein CBM2587_A20212 [Cupriavidus taiwanensis]
MTVWYHEERPGCVGESPSWSRHRILIPAFEGSNPSSPAITSYSVLTEHDIFQVTGFAGDTKLPQQQDRCPE